MWATMRTLTVAVLAGASSLGWGQSAATKPTATHPTRHAHHTALAPITERERAEQVLNRLTFGPRPGDVDRVLAIGVDKWLEQQLNPETIDDAALDRRLADYPTLRMTPAQARETFPDRGLIQQVADGKHPYPADPLLAAMYEVQVAKLERERSARTPGPDGKLPPEPTDAEKKKERTEGQAIAARVAGELFALPKNRRMAALAKMPVNDRIAFTSYVSGEQKNELMAGFTPREREVFLAMQSNVGASYNIYRELAQAKMVRAILSQRQLQEVMTDFWFNHFNVYIGKDSDQWYTTAYERDVIRRYALGKFGDLLLATAQHPAMLVYLDNWLSIGPDSLANGVNPKNPRAKRGNRGLNENYGREIMELHTVGVNGGYSQADVTNLSAILTGWTVDQAKDAFEFDPRRHEPGAKTWLGHVIGSGPAFVIQGSDAAHAEAAEKAATPMEMSMSDMEGMADGMSSGGAEQSAVVLADAPGNQGMREGIEALNLLAHSPATAHFISQEIAQRFVADDPPPALVDRMAKTFLASDGDIKAVLRAMVASPEFNSKRYFRNKVKTPMEFLASAYRTTLTDPANPQALVDAMHTMGMELYHSVPPTGYAITADKWMNAGALVDRLNFAYRLTSGRFANQSFDAAKVVALGLVGESSLPVAHPASRSASGRVLFAPAAMTSSPTGQAIPAGTQVALRVLESSLTGGPVSAHTNASIERQIEEASQQQAAPADTLNLLTALVMGSPEFQLR